VGHHSSSSHIPQVGQTFPLETTPRPPKLNTTNSAPADLSTPISAASDSVNNESHVDPSVDLETGSNAQLTSRRRFWKRNGKPERQHHELTARAHGKTPLQLFKEILYSSWANLLLVFVPVGIALHFVNVSPTVIFVMNFLAIVPLAGVFPCGGSVNIVVEFCYGGNCHQSGSDFGRIDECYFWYVSCLTGY
jgi:hypothetical protein